MSPLRKGQHRTVLNLETKLQILNRLEMGESVDSLSKIFKVGISTIHKFKGKRDEIMSFALNTSTCDDGLKKRKYMRKPKDEVLNEAMYVWCMQRKSQGEPITGPILCEKALELNNRLGGMPEFKASNGWLRNFKARHGIRLNDEEIASYRKEEQWLHEVTDSGEVIGDRKGEEHRVSGPSDKEAFVALETAIAWYEQKQNCSAVHLLVLKELRELAANTN